MGGEKKESKSKYVWVPIVIAALVVLFTFFAFLNMSENEMIVTGITTVLGTLFSLLGLIYTIYQVVSLKSETKKVERRIDDSLKSFRDVLSVVDYAKAIALIESIQSDLNRTSYTLAIYKMEQLKYLLLQNRNEEFLKTEKKFKDYNSLVADLSIIIESLNDYIQNPETNPKPTNMTSIMQNMSMLLIEIEGILKLQGAIK